MQNLKLPASSGSVEIKLDRDQLRDLKHYFEEKGIEHDFGEDVSNKHANEIDQAIAYWLFFDEIQEA